MNAEDQGSLRRNEYISVLSLMVDLLFRNGDQHQAGVVKTMAERISLGESVSTLDTNDVWGGAGSVVDCSFLRGNTPSDEAIAEESKFGEIIIRLVDLLEKDGVATDLMKSRRKSYLFWKSKRTQNPFNL